MRPIDRRSFIKALSAAPDLLPTCGDGSGSTDAPLYAKEASANPCAFVGHFEIGVEAAPKTSGAYEPSVQFCSWPSNAQARNIPCSSARRGVPSTGATP